MPNPIVKGLACCCGLGGICGGIVLIAKNVNRESKPLSVREKLMAQGHKLLDFNETTSGEWKRIETAYGEATSEGKRFSNMEAKGGQVIDGIKDNCLKLIEKTEISESEYSKVKIWCVVPVMVGSKFSPEALLNHSPTDSKDNESWDKLAKKHWDSGTKAELRISNENKTSGEDRRTEIKLKCEKGLQVDSISDLFDDVLNKVGMWCTKEAANKITG